MIKIAPRLDPRIYILKSYHSKDENIPLSQSNYKWGWSYPQIAMHAYAPCGLIVSKLWVSHSQPRFSRSHCAHIITKHGGAFNTSSSLALPKWQSVFIQSASQGCIDTRSPRKLSKVTLRTTMHWYTTSTRQSIFFPTRFCAKPLNDGLFDSHRWCIYTPPVSPKHFPLK